jgi:hypothetical protein
MPYLNPPPAMTAPDYISSNRYDGNASQKVRGDTIDLFVIDSSRSPGPACFKPVQTLEQTGILGGLPYNLIIDCYAPRLGSDTLLTEIAPEKGPPKFG